MAEEFAGERVPGSTVIVVRLTLTPNVLNAI